MKNGIVKSFVFLLSLLSLPLVLTAFSALNDELLASLGFRANSNYSGGSPLARFDDPAHDLLQPLPVGYEFATYENELDLRAFSVTKVAFPPFAGQGIAPRMNLVFEFDGRLQNPFESSNGFSLALLQAFLDSPDLSSESVASNRIPELAFPDEHAWDYQVMIDGFHDQARIYDARGLLVGRGLNIRVEEVMEEAAEATGSVRTIAEGAPVARVAKTRITASIPIASVGDPARGEWKYYVAVGLVDPLSPKGMRPLPLDCIRYRKVGGVVELQPLIAER